MDRRKDNEAETRSLQGYVGFIRFRANRLVGSRGHRWLLAWSDGMEKKMETTNCLGRI